MFSGCSARIVGSSYRIAVTAEIRKQEKASFHNVDAENTP